MWSYIDDVACHKRRYSKKDIKLKLNLVGFEIKYYTSFVFTLFPFMLASRLFKKFKNISADCKLKELGMNKYINGIFEVILKIDELFIKLGFRLPFGGSLIMVACKK